MYARTNRCYNERGSRTNYVVLACPTVLCKSPSVVEWLMLAIAPKVLEFKLGRGRWITNDNKKGNMTSFGGEVKPSVKYRKILRHVKEPYRYERNAS
jgi:hypothetical protein